LFLNLKPSGVIIMPDGFIFRKYKSVESCL